MPLVQINSSVSPDAEILPAASSAPVHDMRPHPPHPNQPETVIMSELTVVAVDIEHVAVGNDPRDWLKHRKVWNYLY